ncbi:MAG: hypothetical protein J3K34DRAFT_519952 [Monoraphidium minutum]|nr:MAG: hypothetical protein J3K34DRAFT_519952 [Monoraphidium minutum]
MGRAHSARGNRSARGALWPRSMRARPLLRGPAVRGGALSARTLMGARAEPASVCVRCAPKRNAGLSPSPF